MSKLTREQKLDIYKKQKDGKSIALLSKEYSVNMSVIQYLIRVIDKHGEGILRNDKNNFYSLVLKEEIINKVLVNNQSVKSTAIEYGLLSYGMLSNWIKSYKDNGYVIVERTRGRSPTMKTNQSKKEYSEMTLEEKNEFNEKRIQYLQAENEYLKKLRAVVQARKNQQPKKK